MFARLPRLAVAVALSCSIGLHWALFQSLAWAGMVLSYSQSAPLTEALAKTFDGEHPCPLCKAIAKGKRSEKKPDLPQEFKKFDFLTARAEFIFSAPAHWWLLPAANGALESLRFAPPTPPPRGLPA